MLASDRLLLPDYTCQVSVSIANGQSQSTQLDCGGLRPVALQIPVAWTAAPLSFEGSLDNVTFLPIFDATGAQHNISAAGMANLNSFIINTTFSLLPLQPFRFLRFISGTTAIPVNQLGVRTLTWLLGYQTLTAKLPA